MPAVLLVGGSAVLSMAPAVADAGFEVAYEQSVSDALDRLRTFRADVSVLPTTDITPEFVAALRQAAPRCRILAVVGTSGASASDLGVTLASPDDPDGFVAAIWRLTATS